MPLHSLVRTTTKHKKLVGRGTGSGHGKTSTRGHKGQRSRSGRDFYLGFEGGQSPLIRRIPKRGFVHTVRRKIQIVNLSSLVKFPGGAVIDPVILGEKGLINNVHWPVKILGNGEIKQALTVKVHAFSASALKKIESTGGKAEVIKLA